MLQSDTSNHYILCNCFFSGHAYSNLLHSSGGGILFGTLLPKVVYLKSKCYFLDKRINFGLKQSAMIQSQCTSVQHIWDAMVTSAFWAIFPRVELFSPGLRAPPPT